MSKSIDALARGMFVLEEILRNSPISLAELHRSTEISKATLLRILKTLIDVGWVIRSDELGGYLFSNSLGKNSTHMELSIALRTIALPTLKQLCSESESLVELWMPETGKMSIIGSAQPQSFPISDFPSYTAPLPLLTSPIGLVYLSFCNETERLQLLNEVREQPGKSALLLQRDPLWFQQTLHTIEAQGFAYQKPNGNAEAITRGNMEVLALPVMKNSVVLGVLSLSRNHCSNRTASLEETILSKAQHTAREIEYSLENSIRYV